MDTTTTHTNSGQGSGRDLLLITSAALRKVARGITIALAVSSFSFLASCSARSEEAEFYRSPRSDWPNDLMKYPYQDQWKIFLYGMARRETPPYELTLVLAKGKERILDQVIKTINETSSRSDIDGASATLETMVTVDHFDPCSYPKFQAMSVQSALRNRVPGGEKFMCSSDD